MLQLSSSCFPAGTLVHTRDGLRPIESVPAGTHVPCRSAKTGEQGWKRVLRTVRHDARPLCRIRLFTEVGGEPVVQELMATDRHLFYVAGYFNNGGFSDEYFEELDKPIGWSGGRFWRRGGLC